MPKRSTLTASSKAFDPHLEALFATSSGPVQAPPKSRYAELKESKKQTEESGDDEVLSEASEELDYEDEEDGTDGSGDSSSEEEDSEESASEDDAEEAEESGEAVEENEPRRERKRKRKDENEDLEEKYLSVLAEEDDAEPEGKRLKAEDKDKESEDDEEDNEEAEDLPVHESLDKAAKAEEADKAARTVFLANVSTDAISNKAAKKTLVKHLSSALDSEDYPIQKLESIRFRSTAFSTGSMPKRAAYITKSLMDSTSHSTNAYAVFSTTAAARRVCAKLNGTEVLGRHIRVDNVAHPSPTDHRRCVFVGNLGFVDDETVLNKNEDGDNEAKKRNKVPADVEEGLWRTFSKHGKVENVRVVRDPKTRVGKGFAYVQFYDGNDVEAALLLNEKKFPPMLPRKLRVVRAKDPRKTAQAVERSAAKANGNVPSKRGSNSTYNPKMTPDQQAAAGRAGKLFGRKQGGVPNGFKAPEKFVFEGRRATTKDALPKDLKAKKKGKGKKGRPTNRGARRASAWQKKGSA